MVNDIRFKSYCWSIGTTSYRTDNFNMNIERQLALMKEFRRLPANRDKAGAEIINSKQNIMPFKGKKFC